MSKGGGAGKVYFVLYLAVVLELLIIIVERDEAEESLHQKQKETMRIVESILSQLQSGAGTEGINTRPQDEITIPPSGVDIKTVMGADIKSFRKYIVEVGVTDISTELQRKEGESEKEYTLRLKKLVKLGNVEEIEYQIFFNPSQDANNAPMFPGESELRKKGVDFTKFEPGQTIEGPNGDIWEFMSLRKLKLDEDQTFNNINLANVTNEAINPIYPNSMVLIKGQVYAQNGISSDSVFFYSTEETYKFANASNATGLKKRAFAVNFQPPSRAGWYKLRFSSRTNRILGVRSDVKANEIDEQTTVNIGTVQLTVRDLEKVKRELISKLEKYDLPSDDILIKEQDVDKFNKVLEESKKKAAREENANEIVSKVELYGYIAKLLAPGQSINFDQNRGSIEFNIRVITPNPPISEPTVTLPSYTACFDKLEAVLEFTISPYQSTGNIIEGRVLDVNGSTVARINCRPYDEIASTASRPTSGGSRIYHGTVDKELSPGKYTLEVTHKLSGRSKTEVATLEVFKTSLAADNEALLKSRLEIVNYGQQFLLFNAIPTSGGKIRPEQFRMYLTTDIDQQRSPIEGLTCTKDNSIFLSSNAKQASMKITWKQPLTDKEVDLFPLKNVDIEQGRPKINPMDNISSVTPIGNNKIRVTIRNIKVAKPNDGVDENSLANVEVKVDKQVTIDKSMQGVSQASEPTIEMEDNSYTVSFDLDVKLERGQEMVNGIVSAKVTASAINNGNKKRSKPEDKIISVNVKYEPERRGGSQRRTTTQTPSSTPSSSGGSQRRK